MKLGLKLQTSVDSQTMQKIQFFCHVYSLKMTYNYEKFHANFKCDPKFFVLN